MTQPCSSTSARSNGTTSFSTARTSSIVPGSVSNRSLCCISTPIWALPRNGSLHEARVIGDGRVLAALRSNGTVGAAWCSPALLFFKENKVINAAEALDRPHTLTMFGNDVVLVQGNEVQVVDAHGQLLWSVQFSKAVTGIAAHGDTLVCAAGVLTAFRRKDR